MTTRTNKFGNAMPGEVIEYAGDLPAPTRTYAASFQSSSIGERLNVPATSNRTGSAVVHRVPRQGGLETYRVYGLAPMPVPLRGAPAYGSVVRSYFQRLNRWLSMWQIYPELHGAGYPQNLGLTFQAPALKTQFSPTGGPTAARMSSRPMFTKVQEVPRSAVLVGRYRTRSAQS